MTSEAPRIKSDESAVKPRGRRIAGLVRHGHFDRPDNVASSHLLHPLSPLGREQSRQAATKILEVAENLQVGIDSRIESSELLRAHQTARLLAQSLTGVTGQTFEVSDRPELLERGLGSGTNLRFDEIASLLETDDRLGPLPEGWRRIPDFRLPVPGAESLLAAGERTALRIEASLNEVYSESSSDVLRLFVAHDGCLRHAAVHFGILDVARVSQLTIDHGQAVFIERGPDGKWGQVAGEWLTRPPPETTAG